jgi:putative transcriptional regulator
MQSSAPGFLIAMPNLRDPNFDQAVILMLEHSTDGAVGLVINRPIPDGRETVISGLGLIWHPESIGDVRAGGPVRTQAGCILHPPEWHFEDTQIITPTLSVSTSREALDTLAALTNCPFRLMLGYAGWGASQLEREITEGTWLSTPVNEALVFADDADSIYDRAVESLGINRYDLVPGAPAIN